MVILKLIKVTSQRITLMGAFVFFLLNTIQSQEANLRFRNLSVKDGLSYNTVVCFLEDSKNRIWIGTVDGLNLYDGSKFTVYKPRTGGLLGNQINKILEDTCGRLWIATYSGLNLYIANLDSFIDINRILGKKKIDLRINDIFFENSSKLWIGTLSGLYELDINSLALRFFSVQENHPDSLNNTITTLFKDKQNNFWIGTESGGLNLYNRKENKFIKFNLDKNSGKKIINSVRAIYQDSRDNLWIASDLGLMQFDYSSQSLIKYEYDERNPNGPMKGMARSIFEDKKNRLWVGFQYSLTYYDRDKKTFHPVRKDLSNSWSIKGDEVWSMMQDSQGNIWFGFFTASISIFNYDISHFKVYQNNPNNPNSIQGNSILGFCEDKKGNVWIGIDHAGLDYFDREKDIFIHYRNISGNKNSLSSNSVLSVDFDHKGNLWIGTWGGGLNKFDPEKNAFKTYLPDTHNENSICGIHIWKAIEDKYNNIIIATHQEGICYYNPEEGKFSNYKHDPRNAKSLADNSVNTIYRDRRDVIWLATLNGVSRLENDKFEFKNFLPKKYVNDLFDDNKGKLWIATSGLFSINLKTDEVDSYDTLPGIETNMITGILEDDKNNLWISTVNRGLSKVNKSTFKVKNYVESDGLFSLTFNRRARLKLSDGNMMFGTSDGFVIFHPDSIKDILQTPKLIFTDFLLFNEPAKISDVTSPLKEHITFSDTIILNSDQSVFTICYSALNYCAPERNNYAFMLEGFEKKWNYVGAKREATYTNLDPGTYIFRVKVSINPEKWSVSDTILTIIVLPPWWKTKISVVSFILLILGSFLGFYFYRVNALKKRTILLEKIVEERTHELSQQNILLNEKNILLNENQMMIEEKNQILRRQALDLNDINTQLEERQMQIEEQSEELLAQKEELLKQRDELNELNNTKDKLFSILAHDLRSPFNTIIGYSDLLYNNLRKYSIDKIETQLGYIRAGARNTFDLLNNLLDWSRAQRGAIEIVLEDANISELLESELLILRQQALRKEVAIEVAVRGEVKAVRVDPNIFQTVIRNLISNAIKYSNSGGVINVEIFYDNERLVFSVKDQGTGMSAETVQALFKLNKNESKRGTAGEKGTGLGLLLCADFISRHNGKIWAESKENEGSTFVFSIPY